MLKVNQIICGEAGTVLKDFPAESINCCITSPPFWALRDYGIPPSIWDGNKECKHKWGKSIIKKGITGGTDNPFAEKLKIKGIENYQETPDSSSQFCSRCGAWRGCLGLEPTFELYIDHLCTIYDAVWRVLRKDGTCFVNLGDTYWGGKGQSGRCDHNLEQRVAEGRSFQRREYTLPTKHCPQDGKHEFVQAKSLCLIPQRFAIEMVNRGWILRNVIIWHKPNPMPSSAKDRFTVDFEYVFFFVKQQHYWFEPQYEPYECAKPESVSYRKSGKSDSRKNRPDGIMPAFGDEGFWKPDNPLGRNKRTVWTIPTQAYSEAHFATFPEKLVEPMIKAGCPEFVCKKCGMGRRKVIKLSPQNIKKRSLDNKTGEVAKNKPMGINPLPQSITGLEFTYKREHIGYTDCGCNAGWRPGIVLDLFRRQWNRWQGGRPIAA